MHSDYTSEYYEGKVLSETLLDHIQIWFDDGKDAFQLAPAAHSKPLSRHIKIVFVEGDSEYILTPDDKWWKCTCRDYRAWGLAEKPFFCKHAVAIEQGLQRLAEQCEEGDQTDLSQSFATIWEVVRKKRPQLLEKFAWQTSARRPIKFNPPARLTLREISIHP